MTEKETRNAQIGACVDVLPRCCCNQGTFLRKREDPGNEVGDIVIHTVGKKVHNFDLVHICSIAHAVLVNVLLSLIQEDF